MITISTITGVWLMIGIFSANCESTPDKRKLCFNEFITYMLLGPIPLVVPVFVKDKPEQEDNQ